MGHCRVHARVGLRTCVGLRTRLCHCSLNDTKRHNARLRLPIGRVSAPLYVL